MNNFLRTILKNPITREEFFSLMAVAKNVSSEVKTKDFTDYGEINSKYVPYIHIVFVFEFALLYFFIYFYDTIKEHCIYAPILIKVLALEMGYYIMFAEVEVLGNRLHELFGMFNVLAYTQCLYIIKPRYVVRIGLAAFSLIYYLVQMYNEV